MGDASHNSAETMVLRVCAFVAALFFQARSSGAWASKQDYGALMEYHLACSSSDSCMQVLLWPWPFASLRLVIGSVKFRLFTDWLRK